MNTGTDRNSRSFKSTLGMYYYQSKRYLEWLLVRKKQYSRIRKIPDLPHVAFSHSTPLIRKLKNVDLWMQRNKVKNLRIAIKRLNGVVIQPGEIFSYWRLIGRPTRSKGYVEGMLLWEGQVTTGVGGGLCQLSNHIYWMTLHTPLTVTERYRHEFDVFPDADRTVPFGSGATCFYNYIDLQIYNGTKQPYQLNLYLTDDDLNGEWRTDPEQPCTYEVYQKDHLITHEYGGRYMRHNTIWRKTYNMAGELIVDEYISENHAQMMYQPLLSERTSTSPQTQYPGSRKIHI